VQTLIAQNAYWPDGGVTQHSDTGWHAWVSCTLCSKEPSGLTSMSRDGRCPSDSSLHGELDVGMGITEVIECFSYSGP
jgi:hypothetical protein